MSSIVNLMYVTWKWTLRDRILHSMLGVSLLLLLLIPSFSMFSMRQVQELSITLSLSAVSFVLLVLAILLGGSSIWRDLEKRYAGSVLGMPISRGAFVVGKFAGIACLLFSCALLLGAASFIVVSVTSTLHPSDVRVNWLNLGAAVFFDALKYVLLAAWALLFSVLSTSFFLPFFGTISIFLAGSASQEVYEYVSGEFGRTMAPAFKGVVQAMYYLLPNFSAFNLKVHAVYALPLSAGGLLYTLGYFLVYTALLITVSIWIFSRRDLP